MYFTADKYRQGVDDISLKDSTRKAWVLSIEVLLVIVNSFVQNVV